MALNVISPPNHTSQLEIDSAPRTYFEYLLNHQIGLYQILQRMPKGTHSRDIPLIDCQCRSKDSLRLCSARSKISRRRRRTQVRRSEAEPIPSNPQWTIHVINLLRRGQPQSSETQ